MTEPTPSAPEASGPAPAPAQTKRSLGAEFRAVLFLYGIVLVLALALRSLGG